VHYDENGEVITNCFGTDGEGEDVMEEELVGEDQLRNDVVPICEDGSFGMECTTPTECDRKIFCEGSVECVPDPCNQCKAVHYDKDGAVITNCFGTDGEDEDAMAEELVEEEEAALEEGVEDEADENDGDVGIRKRRLLQRRLMPTPATFWPIPKYRGVAIYALVVSVLSLIHALVTAGFAAVSRRTNQNRRCNAKFQLIFMAVGAILWILVACLTTFIGPFTTTGNAYFAAWGGVACSILSVLIFKKEIEQSDIDGRDLNDDFFPPETAFAMN